MPDSALQLANAPIVEAVLDIDCAPPPALEIASLEEAARDQFRDGYPKFRKQFVHERSIKQAPDGPAELSGRTALQALQFLTEDERQIVQVRANGFSFNRLAPYGSLDDYLPEIHKRWTGYREIATPIQIRKISLRYINRILVPLEGGQAKLEDYFNTSPQLPDNADLSFTGFLQQHQAIEAATANRVRIVMASQPVEASNLPVTLDIAALREERLEPENWEQIAAVICSLRDLKNRVFKNSLTPPCLNRY